jgi:hypothetical protein
VAGCSGAVPGVYGQLRQVADGCCCQVTERARENARRGRFRLDLAGGDVPAGETEILDEGPTAEGHADSGLLFASYQADVARQFLPIQRRLAEADLLNEWTTPIGSAVFAVPPGCAEDGWIGETLLGKQAG